MSAQRRSRVRDRLAIWVQIPLGRGERSVPGDLSQDVHRFAGICHPRQPGMAQIVTSQMLVAQGSKRPTPLISDVRQSRSGPEVSELSRVIKRLTTA